MLHRTSAAALYRSARGFTLVELMVVIAIIAILGGLAIFGVTRALESGKISQTQQLINQLEAAIQDYRGSEIAEGVPPVSLTYFTDDEDFNGLNEGIESLLLCLRMRRGGGPFVDVTEFSDMLEDRDENQEYEALYELFQIEARPAKLFEIIDAWGNPLVYIPRYNVDERFRILDREDEVIEVEARAIEGLGEFPADYLIWSFGPNGRNENGGGDDITSWKKKGD